MEALIPGLLIWICLQIGCEPPPPPAIIWVSQETLVERVYGDQPHDGACVCGCYDHETQTVWLPHGCDPDDLLNRSTLLHELVHHVQTVTGMAYPCPAARERLAYGLQAQWLREAGVEDPYAAMDMDEFTIVIRSICWPEE
jgi:hypothetical protein